MDMLASVLQMIVALGIFNVWILRAGTTTRYRGGGATSLREEFAAYGLPNFVFYAVGAVKLTAALVLIVALWIPSLAPVAATVIAVLMVGALAMHLKVRDPLIRSAPALVMLACTVTIALVRAGR